MSEERINKEVFIMETAAKIFAGMFSNHEKDHNEKVAVEEAINLWEELKKAEIITDK